MTVGFFRIFLSTVEQFEVWIIKQDRNTTLSGIRITPGANLLSTREVISRRSVLNENSSRVHVIDDDDGGCFTATFVEKVMKRSERWNAPQICPRRHSNSGGSDLRANALLTRPQRHPLCTFSADVADAGGFSSAPDARGHRSAFWLREAPFSRLILRNGPDITPTKGALWRQHCVDVVETALEERRAHMVFVRKAALRGRY